MDPRIVLPALALACDPSITVASGSALQVSWDGVAYTHLPALLVVAIDDGSDADATAVRALITHDSTVASFEMLLLRNAPWSYTIDPASGFTEEAQVVIVHPRSGSFVAPLDDPRLRFAGNATPADLADAASAVIAHAQEDIAAPDTAYPLIGRTREVVSLLLRERAPRDAREAAIVASMPEAFRTVTVTMVTSRDDETRGPIELPPKSESDWIEYDVIAQGTESNPPPVPILTAWSQALTHEQVFAFVHARCCSDTTPIYVFAEEVDYSCDFALSANRIARDAEGAAECSITFDSIDVTSCDPARGWADPIGRDGIRRPWFDMSDGVTARRCEILQLTGAARTSCEHSVPCEDCSPGFCVTSLFDSTVGCPNLARFVDASMFFGVPRHGTRLHFTCNFR